MVEILDSTISIHSLIWLFLVAFMLHDFEEIIRIEAWFKRHYNEIQKKAPRSFQTVIQSASQITTSQFSLAVCIEFIVFIPITLLAAEKNIFLVFLGFNVVLLLHVFMHLGQALLLQMVVPGVITAVCITLPYSVYLFYRLLKENLIEWTDIFISLPFGLLLGPIVWLGYKAGDLLRAKEMES